MNAFQWTLLVIAVGAVIMFAISRRDTRWPRRREDDWFTLIIGICFGLCSIPGLFGDLWAFITKKKQP